MTLCSVDGTRVNNDVANSTVCFVVYYYSIMALIK